MGAGLDGRLGFGGAREFAEELAGLLFDFGEGGGGLGGIVEGGAEHEAFCGLADERCDFVSFSCVLSFCLFLFFCNSSFAFLPDTKGSGVMAQERTV